MSASLAPCSLEDSAAGCDVLLRRPFDFQSTVDALSESDLLAMSEGKSSRNHKNKITCTGIVNRGEKLHIVKTNFKSQSLHYTSIDFILHLDPIVIDNQLLQELAKSLQEYHVTVTLQGDILSSYLQPSASFLHCSFELLKFLLKAASKSGPPSFRKDDN